MDYEPCGGLLGFTLKTMGNHWEVLGENDLFTYLLQEDYRFYCREWIEEEKNRRQKGLGGNVGKSLTRVGMTSTRVVAIKMQRCEQIQEIFQR